MLVLQNPVCCCTDAKRPSNAGEGGEQDNIQHTTCRRDHLENKIAHIELCIHTVHTKNGKGINMSPYKYIVQL
jgi:hypothetical protein